jgi:hypothetical protein
MAQIESLILLRLPLKGLKVWIGIQGDMFGRCYPKGENG